MRAYLRDRAIGLASFIGDLALGAFFFAFLIGTTFNQSDGHLSEQIGQFLTEALALGEGLGLHLGVGSLSVHLFFISSLTLFLRAVFILILGRGPGDMAVGRVAFGSLKERAKHAGQNLLMVVLPPLCLLPDPRRRVSLSWSLIILLLVAGFLWPWPMLWRLNDGTRMTRNEFAPVSELKLDVGQGNYSEYVVFESRVFGLEALSENPEKLLTFPCPQSSAWSGRADVCFYDVETKDWLILSMPGPFSLQEPLARYLEFSKWLEKFGADNLTELVVQAMALGPYDGIRAALAHGPFLQGLLSFKLFLLQLGETSDSGKENTLVKIGGQDFFQVQQENSDEWFSTFFPLEIHSRPFLKLSGPARSTDLKERFARTFISSIKWSQTDDQEEKSGIGGQCDFVSALADPPEIQELAMKENALVKLYVSVAKVAIKQKSVALRRLLLRTFKQFKRSGRNQVSERLEKSLNSLFLGLTNNDSTIFQTEDGTGGNKWK